MLGSDVRRAARRAGHEPLGFDRGRLDVCDRGLYPARELSGLTPKQRDSYFTRIGDDYKVKPKIKGMVTFAPLNLAQAVYMGKFDIIFCMNVLIYFSEERRSGLIQRFYEYLEPGGYLFLGHAESVAKAQTNFEPIVVGDSMIYRKPLPGSANARAMAAMTAGTEKAKL